MMKHKVSNRLNLTAMAAAVNLTPEHFCRLFRAEMGEPPARYFKALKMNEAKNLIETSFLNVKEIILIVGLSDYSHFVRDFKTLYGMTPKKYRHQYPRSLLDSSQQTIFRSDKFGQHFSNPANKK
jgi:AraC-like DNA-binding protein